MKIFAFCVYFWYKLYLFRVQDLSLSMFQQQSFTFHNGVSGAKFEGNSFFVVTHCSREDFLTPFLFLECLFL